MAASVPEVAWCQPGERAAAQAMSVRVRHRIHRSLQLGSSSCRRLLRSEVAPPRLSCNYCDPALSLQRFLSARLKSFDELRNNPTQPGATSNLSPYLHFGE